MTVTQLSEADADFFLHERYDSSDHVPLSAAPTDGCTPAGRRNAGYATQAP